MPLPPPTKKRKLQGTITNLESTLLDAIPKNASLNPLADLLALMLDTEDPHDTSKAIYAVYRVIVIIISNGKLELGGDDAARVVKTWILSRMNIYVDFLGGLLQDDEKFLRISSLQILFSLLRHLSTNYSKSSQPQIHASHFRRIVSFLLLCPHSQRKSSTLPQTPNILDPDVLVQFYDTWFSVYDDIRWFFLRDAGTLLNDPAHKNKSGPSINLLSILERLTTFPTEQAELNSWWIIELGAKPPKPRRVSKDASTSDDDEEPKNQEGDDDDWRKFFDDDPLADDGKVKGPSSRLHQLSLHQSLHSLLSHRAVFTRVWLTLLPNLSRFGAPERKNTLAMRALNIMHRGVLPNLTRPILVMDWIAGCVDMGGSVGLLALNALFILIKDYNLDYPSFYTRLYAFLDRDVLHLKHRARFFRLTETFLSSTHLPAQLLASFVKRLSRLTLSAPPAAIIMVIPFTYNILKRHPALMVMIHRNDVADALIGDFVEYLKMIDTDPWIDPFLPNEPNPQSTNAIDSSLWELMSHTNHYHAPVSTLCKIFSEAFTKPGYSMEDFLDHSYGTLFETEVLRKIKRDPALAMDEQLKLVIFPTSTFPLKATSSKEDAEAQVTDEPDDVGSTESNRDVVSELWAF